MAFSTKREGDQTPQIYILPMSGGEARRVTNVPGGATGPQWRPDGKAILFQSQVDPIAEQRKDRKWNARIYDAMPIRFWNAWLDERSEEHTSELQSLRHLVCRLLLEKKKS